jgi:hypothetical protein
MLGLRGVTRLGEKRYDRPVYAARCEGIAPAWDPSSAIAHRTYSFWAHEGSVPRLIHFRRRPSAALTNWERSNLEPDAAMADRWLPILAGNPIYRKDRKWGQHRAVVKIAQTVMVSYASCSGCGMPGRHAVDARQAYEGLRPPQAGLPRSSMLAKPLVARHSISDYFGRPWSERLR